jgi:hypothetical protein
VEKGSPNQGAPSERHLIIGSHILGRPVAPRHRWYFGLYQLDERKKESLACFCNQDVPKAEHSQHIAR